MKISQLYWTYFLVVGVLIDTSILELQNREHIGILYKTLMKKNRCFQQCPKFAK